MFAAVTMVLGSTSATHAALARPKGVVTVAVTVLSPTVAADDSGRSATLHPAINARVHAAPTPNRLFMDAPREHATCHAPVKVARWKAALRSNTYARGSAQVRG
jgi:hypothetical protein